MTDYETLAWPWSATSDYDRAVGSSVDLADFDHGVRSPRGRDGHALLWQYMSDARGYLSSDDADDEADSVAYERRRATRALLVKQSLGGSNNQDDDEDEGEMQDDAIGRFDGAFDETYSIVITDEHDDGDGDDDNEEGDEEGDDEQGRDSAVMAWLDQEQNGAYFVIDHENGTISSSSPRSVSALLVAPPQSPISLEDDRSSGLVSTNAIGDGDADVRNDREEVDEQRTYADALVSALGDVDEVHMHGDGSVALRKERNLPVVLMGGVGAPAKIADAALTAAQAPDGVTVFLGEVALLADEVGSAERALLADDAGAVVTALHNHWVSDPTLYYLHFQALTRDPTTFLRAVAPWWRSL